MKAYCWYTPSHQIFLDEYLVPTLPGSVDLVAVKADQQCSSGRFMSSGWMKSMSSRCEWWVETISSADEPIIFIDADIQFFKDPLPIINEILNEHDLTGHHDIYVPICCGFMAVKPTPSTISLFNHISKTVRDWPNDQIALNKNLNMVKFKSLPNTFWTAGHDTNPKVWHPGTQINPPNDIILHHGNFTVGLDNKIALMNLVRDRINSQV